MSKIVRSIKNVASGYSSVQVLVRNATLNDPSGPTTHEMEEIASNTYTSQTDFLEIMDMLDRRLNDKGKNWRHVAKSLTVLEYLVRYGLEKCVLWLKDNLYIIKTLREFIHFDETNNDQGAIIRVKAKELVSLLRDDERLRQERASVSGSRNGRERRKPRSRENDAPYDNDLERALELSRITAEDDLRRQREELDDPDLQAALKLSMEEEEMRKQNASQGQNLLDLNDDPQQQQFYATGYYQQPQYFQQPQQFQQLDLFGNPIQNLNTGLYQQPQYTQYQQPQQPMFTGFNYGQQQQQQQQQFQQQQPQEPLQPLKTGSNNPFALSTEKPAASQPTLNDLNTNLFQQFSQQQQQQQQQPQQVQQPAQPQQLAPQRTSGSKFDDSTHGELNNLLAQGTGIDTFGNTGATRIPHQHTKTGTFINLSGTGYKQQSHNVQVSSNATGNPFLQQQPTQQFSGINPAYTGYGFGNALQQQPQKQQRSDGPSLIDI